MGALNEIIDMGTLSIKLLLAILAAGFYLSALMARKRREERIIRLTIGTFFVIILLWFHIYWSL